MKSKANKTSTKSVPIYENVEDPDNLRNGNKVCSAHSLLIQMIQSNNNKLDEIDGKVDQLLIDKAIEDKEASNAEKESNKKNRWKEIKIAAFYTGIGGIIAGIMIKIVEFFTPL